MQWLIAAILAFASDPFSTAARVRVLLFVRTDCPITNRYAPELQRIAAEFTSRGVNFSLIYPDPSETGPKIAEHIREYNLPGQPVRDPHHDLVNRAHATTAPEAAVFDSAGRLLYHGRIDDLYIDVGKSRPAARTHDLEDAIEDVLNGRPVKEAETRAIGCSLADVQ